MAFRKHGLSPLQLSYTWRFLENRLNRKIPDMKIGSEKWNELIIDGARSFGIMLPPDMLNKFSAYAEELLAWNRKINITAITDPFEIAVKHFVDSMAPASLVRPDDKLIDIGSGGGFPGIPLAIIYPSVQTTLIDPARKKVNFLKHIGRLLQLQNLTVYQRRAEDMLKEDAVSAKSFTVVISRALFPVDKLISIALPILSDNGRLIAMRGKKVNEEKALYAAKKKLQEWKNGHPKRRYEIAVHAYELKQIHASRAVIHIPFTFEKDRRNSKNITRLHS